MKSNLYSFVPNEFFFVQHGFQWSFVCGSSSLRKCQVHVAVGGTGKHVAGVGQDCL